ncbi:MAG: hypothetical protein PVJ28_09600 [Acidimicrobiia bacterium]|jgi:hypothetical protein
MRDHELELIAALVEGRLEDEAEARALVESAPQFRVEYEEQKIAYEALSTVGTASLTENERAGLRRDIWTELRAEHSAAPQKTPWYYRWVPALAGMFVVVGLVAVINQGGDDSGEEAVAQLSTNTTAEASSEATESADGETGGDTDSAQEEAMEDEGAGDSQAPEDRSLSPATASFYSAEADMVRSGALAETPSDGGVEPQDSLAPCLEAASLAGYEPLKILTAPIQSEGLDLDSIPVPSETSPIIVAIPEGADVSSAVIAFVDRGSCEVIHLDG